MPDSFVGDTDALVYWFRRNRSSWKRPAARLEAMRDVLTSLRDNGWKSAKDQSALDNLLERTFTDLSTVQQKVTQKLIEVFGTNVKSALGSHRPPLTKKPAAIYRILLELPEHKALTGPAIVAELLKVGIATDESTMRRHFLPRLRPYGLRNKRRVGYYIPLEDRPNSDRQASPPSIK